MVKSGFYFIPNRVINCLLCFWLHARSNIKGHTLCSRTTEVLLFSKNNMPESQKSFMVWKSRLFTLHLNGRVTLKTKARKRVLLCILLRRWKETPFYYPIDLHYEVQIRFYQNRRFIRPHRCAKNGCRLIRQPFLIHKVAGNFHIYGKSTRIALYF